MFLFIEGKKLELLAKIFTLALQSRFCVPNYKNSNVAIFSLSCLFSLASNALVSISFLNLLFSIKRFFLFVILLVPSAGRYARGYLLKSSIAPLL